MNAMRLAQTLASNPFFQFAKLGTVNRNAEEHIQLGFDSFLKNHIGTLHAGALFTVAQADAQAQLEQALALEAVEWKITAYSSQIVYKRPAKGPVWVKTDVSKIDLETGKVTIKHGEIKHMDMPGMTMVFTAKDKSLLTSIKPGEKIKFMVINEGGKMIVTDIQLVQ